MLSDLVGVRTALRKAKRLLFTAAALAAATAFGRHPVALGAPSMAMPDPQMQAVLNQLAALHGKPIEKCTPAEARHQPGPGDAVKALLIHEGVSTAPEHVASVEDKSVPGPAGLITVRVYKPEGDGPFPVLVYSHGGGYVIASVSAYDASCRALANDAKCMVISVAYRMAPETKLPAAQEDVYAVTQWVFHNVKDWNGDPKRIAVGGESAGGDLATETCLMARDRKGQMPIYQLLVYPITDNRLSWPSMQENAKAKPLSRAMMAWFFHYALTRPSDGLDPLISPLRAVSLQGLPPATVILAQIDPLRSEGAAYATRLKAAGVPVSMKIFTGVTHEFFGMSAVLDKAKEAQAFASQGLASVFLRK